MEFVLRGVKFEITEGCDLKQLISEISEILVNLIDHDQDYSYEPDDDEETDDEETDDEETDEEEDEEEEDVNPVKKQKLDDDDDFQ